jgi:arginyl-tRNA synthetase
MGLPILHTLTRLFTEATLAAFPPAQYPAMEGAVAVVEVNGNAAFPHHYQCNSAMSVFQRLKAGAGGGGGEGKKKGKGGAAAASGGEGGESVAPPAPPAPAPAPCAPPPPASPVATAAAILKALAGFGAHALIGHLEVSGPGYINVHLPRNYVCARLGALLTCGPRGCRPPSAPAPRTVAIDYSSPNIAKDMHIGHLRSTIIGDAIARVLEFCGHTVHRINHVGDWGTQFGMLIAHLKDLVAAGVPDGALDESLADLTGFYKQAKKRFDGNELKFAWAPGVGIGPWPTNDAGETSPWPPARAVVHTVFPGGLDFKERSQREVVALQGGDAANKALWERMVRVSADMFASVYRKLGVDPRLQLRGESFYNPLLPALVEELQVGGLLEESEGALIMRIAGQEVPLMVRKKDGGFGYDSTDLAAVRYRIKELGADWLIYVVDLGQALHFELVFAGAARAGWFTPATARVEHVGFGVVQGEDRKRFKTRDGSTVRLVDVLDGAKEKALGVLRERIATSVGSPLAGAPEGEVERTAEALGYGGVKYFDLRQNRTQDYVFSYDRMLSADGDTAVYMQYAIARLRSILRKAAPVLAADAGGGAGGAGDASLEEALRGAALRTAEGAAAAFTFAHATEAALAVELLRFGEVLAGVQEDLMPHRLCEFLYAVAGRVTDFHRDCPVLSSATPPPLRLARLRLVAAAADTMAATMQLIGLDVLERMG